VPVFKWGTLLLLVLVVVVIGSVVMLAVLEPQPPLRHFEVPVKQ
jgi:hypothetical protein